jgi:signal transduction histidine kinase
MLGLLNLFLLATPIASLVLFPFHLIEKVLWMFAHGRNVMAQALWFCLYVFFWTVGFALMMLVTAAFVSKYGTDLSLNSYVAPWLANVFNVLYQWVSFPYHWVCAIFQLGTTSWHFVYSDQVRPLDLKWAKTEDLIVIRDLAVALFGWVWVVSSNFNHRALDRGIRRQEAQADLEQAQQAQALRLAEEKEQERRSALAKERSAHLESEHSADWRDNKKRGISIGRTYD